MEPPAPTPTFGPEPQHCGRSCHHTCPCADGWEDGAQLRALVVIQQTLKWEVDVQAAHEGSMVEGSGFRYLVTVGLSFLVSHKAIVLLVGLPGWDKKNPCKAGRLHKGFRKPSAVEVRISRRPPEGAVQCSEDLGERLGGLAWSQKFPNRS